MAVARPDVRVPPSGDGRGRRTAGAAWRPSALHLLGAAAASVALVPIVYLVVRAAGFGWERIVEVLADERTVALALRSLGLAAAVAVTVMALGIPIAWLTTTDVAGGRWWLVVAALPLAMPSYVVAYTWVAAFPGFDGFWAAWLVLSLCCLPYVVLPVAAVLGVVDPALDDVARSLGCGAVTAFRRAVAPLLLPAAAAGGLLTALYVLSDFGAVSILRFNSFTRVIYASYQSFDRSTAAVLALVLVVLGLVFVLLERRVRGRDQGWRVGAGAARPRTPTELGRLRTPAVGFLVAVFGLAIGFPLVMLAILVARGSRGFDVGEWWSATAHTIEAATIGAAIAIALALPIGMLAARYRDRWSRTTESAAFLSHALPGVLVGLSLVSFSLTVAPGLYQTVALLGFAYAVLYLSNAIGSVRTAANQVPPSLDEVGRSLGVGGFAAWRRITLPLTAPGIAAGTLLVLVTAMKELPATLMLRPTGFDTLATELWTRTSVSAYAAAAPYAVTLVLVAAVPAFVLARVSGQTSPR